MKVETIINENHLCAVIYEYAEGFICTHPTTSMGFRTEQSAMQFMAGTCDGRPFTLQNGTYKMMPVEVREEVEKQTRPHKGS